MFANVRIHVLGFFAALIIFLVLSAYPSVADDQVLNLGPVANDQPIITNVGSKRVVAFYLKNDNRCALYAVAWENSSADASMPQHDSSVTALRLRIHLTPGQTIHIDTPDQDTLNLRCGRNAETLEIADESEYVAFGIATQELLKANVSGF